MMFTATMHAVRSRVASIERIKMAEHDGGQNSYLECEKRDDETQHERSGQSLHNFHLLYKRQGQRRLPQAVLTSVTLNCKPL